MGSEARLTLKIKATIRLAGLGANKEAKVPEGRRRAKDLFGRHADPRSRGSAPEKRAQAAACGATAPTNCRRHAGPPWLTGVHDNQVPHTDDVDAPSSGPLLQRDGCMGSEQG